MNAQEFILKEKTKDKLYEGHPTDKDYWTDSDMVIFAERYYNTKIGINIDKHMKNSIFIRKNYKNSTIPRLLDEDTLSNSHYGFKSIRDINKSGFLTYLLDNSTSTYIQDELLNRLLDENEKKEYEKTL